MDTLVSLQVFCAVAEQKSFVSAANRLGLSTAMASKHVMHLEKRLATRLLNRTSRHVSLTESGALYFEQARHMLEAFKETEDAINKTTALPRGTLRVSAPVWMANAIFAGMLAEYRAQYPDVKLDIDLSGRFVNLVDEGFDLALRVSQNLDAGLVARRLTEIHFTFVASPDFLDRHGRPKTLAEFEGMPFLAYALVSPDGSLTIEGPDGPTLVKFNPVMRSANDALLRFAAIAGMGLTSVPDRLVEQDIAEGRLEAVLPDSARTFGTLYAVYPSRKFLSAKVRTFVDHLVHQVRLRDQASAEAQAAAKK